MRRQLTTAETLVVHVLVAHQLLGAQHTTFDRRLWVKPQLETLRELGLVTWSYDEDANFHVIATESLWSEATAIADSFRDDVFSTRHARRASKGPVVPCRDTSVVHPGGGKPTSRGSR